ncbi:MAG: hypothetical protein J6U60_03160, partial [Clostridia bacterium]|nr:hypothetical protein [Clostridia bacterium]
MKVKAKTAAAFLLAATTAILPLTACKKREDGNFLEDIVTREDYRSVYSKIGKLVTVDMVEEENGLAFVTIEGVRYELGMDFLSMAMVYNTKPVGAYATAEEVYNE